MNKNNWYCFIHGHGSNAISLILEINNLWWASFWMDGNIEFWLITVDPILVVLLASNWDCLVMLKRQLQLGVQFLSPLEFKKHFQHCQCRLNIKINDYYQFSWFYVSVHLDMNLLSFFFFQNKLFSVVIEYRVDLADPTRINFNIICHFWNSHYISITTF